MSDTPEADAKAASAIGFYSCATVPADFARQLERERDALREQLNAKPHECHFEKMVDIRWLHFNRRDPQLQRQLQCACGKTRWCETRSKWAVVVEDTV
jgi:hypothetical protein